jgi:hypothetical protein
LKPLPRVRYAGQIKTLTTTVSLATNNNYSVNINFVEHKTTYDQHRYSSEESDDKMFFMLPPFECIPNKWTSFRTHEPLSNTLMSCSALINNELITQVISPGIVAKVHVAPGANSNVLIKGVISCSTPVEDISELIYENQVYVINATVPLGIETSLLSTTFSTE